MMLHITVTMSQTDIEDSEIITLYYMSIVYNIYGF